MSQDRELLQQALAELWQLRTGATDPTRYLAQLYSSALAEWAGHLGMRPPQLDQLVPSGQESSKNDTDA